MTDSTYLTRATNLATKWMVAPHFQRGPLEEVIAAAMEEAAAPLRDEVAASREESRTLAIQLTERQREVAELLGAPGVPRAENANAWYWRTQRARANSEAEKNAGFRALYAAERLTADRVRAEVNELREENAALLARLEAVKSPASTYCARCHERMYP